jgi:hypothetical protein
MAGFPGGAAGSMFDIDLWVAWDANLYVCGKTEGPRWRALTRGEAALRRGLLPDQG